MSGIRRNAARVVACLVIAAVSAGSIAAEEEPGPKAALGTAAAVFVGKVTDREREGAVNAVTFEVSKSWKGPQGKTLKVITPTSGAFDGYKFREGETYLVYCLPRREDASEAAPLVTNTRTRTRPVDEAADDLKELGEPRD